MEIQKYSKVIAVIAVGVILKLLQIIGITPDMSVQDAVTSVVALIATAVYVAPKNKS